VRRNIGGTLFTPLKHILTIKAVALAPQADKESTLLESVHAIFAFVKAYAVRRPCATGICSR